MEQFKLSILCLLAILFSFTVFAQNNKKALTHDDYASWKSIGEYKISNNGEYVLYTINPQEGDGYLFIENLITKKRDSISRAYSAIFSPNSNYIIFKIKPGFDTLRMANLKKLKKEKLPKDSLGYFNLITNKIVKYPKIKTFKTPKYASDFTAILLELNDKTDDSEDVSDSTKSKKEKKNTDILIITNPITGFTHKYNNVIDYSFSEKGVACAILRSNNDSIDSIYVDLFNSGNMTSKNLYSQKGFAKKITIDNEANTIAFTYTADTAKNKVYNIFSITPASGNVVNIGGDQLAKLPKGKSISNDGKIYFNEDGTELYFGIRKKPIAEPKDTLTKDEKVSVDIWNWKDPLIQPHQLKQVEKEKKRSYTTVYFPDRNLLSFLGNDSLQNVVINKKTKGNFSLGTDNLKYQKELSWDGSRYKDVYLINRNNGKAELILERIASNISMSPDQNFVAWYSIADSNWYVYDIAKKANLNLTSNLKHKFYYELNDIPNEAPAYGIAGWTADEQIIIYDKYDLWMFDPKGKRRPQNITKGIGRKSDIRFRYVKLDREEQFLSKQITLAAFNYENKKQGFYQLSIGEKPMQLIWDDRSFSTPIKAKDADLILWRRQSFVDYPDLYLSNLGFSNIERITNTNPQQKDFNWGTNELVEWKTYDGELMQGIFIKPENFDPNKKYPMLVYFYERRSDKLNSHSTPAPIRSVINFTYYASNGYLIFVPDIKYKTGEPGPSAYNCIVSGTEAMIKKFNFIDADNIGIQGQSWGGYQTAYIITKTNLYKAAMAGAPVSNMTSAYGGVRWGSGMSRAFQYEETQSRIGSTLWERQDLYILNSPLFFIPEIETPLLIMHNDKDGAVPWYQGIEMFNAMRRLEKPVWMLVYNGAPHNLKRRADMKDLTVRMQQFFDFYLKGKAEPRWMKSGVAAIEKGIEFGFETE